MTEFGQLRSISLLFNKLMEFTNQTIYIFNANADYAGQARKARHARLYLSVFLEKSVNVKACHMLSCYMHALVHIPIQPPSNSDSQVASTN